MKRLFIITTLFCISILSKAQTGYFFAHASDNNSKTLYVSQILNVSDYTNCVEESYQTKLQPKECLLKSFRNSIKIEVGSTYYRYDLAVITKRNSNGYGSDEYFSNKNEAEEKRKQIMADYSANDYKIIRLNL